jgi:hypothetical protein
MDLSSKRHIIHDLPMVDTKRKFSTFFVAVPYPLRDGHVVARPFQYLTFITGRIREIPSTQSSSPNSMFIRLTSTSTSPLQTGSDQALFMTRDRHFCRHIRKLLKSERLNFDIKYHVRLTDLEPVIAA